MSNVYIGNPIASHRSAWEYRVFPMLKVPPPRTLYKRARRRLGIHCFAYVFECQSKCITFVENFDRTLL